MSFTEKDRSSELSDIYGITDIIKPEMKDINADEKSVSKSDSSEITWDLLERRLANCSRCKLAETRINTVFGEGDRNAELMFIGEGPGENEDKTGRPFVGAAGKLLTKMIEAMKYRREEVFIANVVKCRPPNNREPFQDEVNACIDYLLAQIELVKPKVIVCLGFTSAKHILKTTTRSYSYRGQFQEYKGITVMPTYHPAYLLYSPHKKKDVWEDLQKVMRLLGKL